ncbi:hypothetical protein Syun_024285 [Stephania yunnanensis]|uniref:Cytochrome P450 n=1 Tax=Stephania yunnanensis TaxID=152371 RepID=A0AAP0I433_9MAGN
MTMDLIPLSVVVILFSLYFLQRLIRSRLKQSNLPPSPPTLPLIGNIHQLGGLLHRSFRDLSQKYGPIILVHFGPVPIVVVSSPAIAEQIMKTHDLVFANRPMMTSTKIILYGCVDVGLSPYGEKWKQLRKICINEFLSVKKVKTFNRVREEEVACMVESIHGSSSLGIPIDVADMLHDLSNDILCRCVLGRKYSGNDGDKRSADIAKRLTTKSLPMSFSDLFSSLGWLDTLTGVIGRLKKTAREFDLFLDQIIEERLSRRTRHDTTDDEKDFVDRLLRIHQEEDGNLTRDNVKALILDMFFAGVDTSAIAAEWAMSELIKNPKVMEKAQEEVRRVVREKGKHKVDEEDIQEMDYLKCVIKETLRLHPPSPTLLPRETSQSSNISGYHIPPKTKVMINAWAIHRDPDLWSRAEEFVPDRFMTENFDFNGQDLKFLPFGAGRRICPGIPFGLAVVELNLANLLYWFDWELPGGADKEGLDMSEALGIEYSRKFPLQLVRNLVFVVRPCACHYCSSCSHWLNKTANELDAHIDEVVEQHIEKKKLGETDGDDEFVYLLLQDHREEKLDLQLTRENMKSVIVDLFIAGIDAS